MTKVISRAEQRRLANSNPDTVMGMLTHIDLDLGESPRDFAEIVSDGDEVLLYQDSYLELGKLLQPERYNALTPRQKVKLHTILRKIPARLRYYDFPDNVVEYARKLKA